MTLLSQPAETEAGPPTRPEAGPGQLPVHDAGSLTGATGLACILLDGRRYLLRITRARKLLLTRADTP
jgi:hemin uptake protein HemP